VAGIDYVIVPLVVPTSLAADNAADFLGLVEAGNAVWRHLVGNDEMAFSADDLLPRWNDQDADPIEGFVARVDGRVVGRSYAGHPRDLAAPDGTVLVEVHPAAQAGVRCRMTFRRRPSRGPRPLHRRPDTAP
jgi:hypothetical protein